MPICLGAYPSAFRALHASVTARARSARGLSRQKSSTKNGIGYHLPPCMGASPALRGCRPPDHGSTREGLGALKDESRARVEDCAALLVQVSGMRRS